MNQNFNIPSNCQNEPFISGNNYSAGLQQTRDVSQNEQLFLNNQAAHYAHCNNVNLPNNCFFPSDESNLSTQNEYVTSMSDHDKQQPVSPHTPQAFVQSSQYYPQISVPKQQFINTRQFSNQNPQFSHNGLHDSSTTTNPSMNYIELFKIEVSGIEIVIRQKSLSRLNQSCREMHEQPPSNLTNRIERIQKNRMHPYNMPNIPPNEQNHRFINRNPVIFRQQHHQHYYSMCQQTNEMDRTSVSENTNNINITQNTLVNQSSVFTQQRTNSFEECNDLNQNL